TFTTSFFQTTTPTKIYTLSLHDALPISSKYTISNPLMWECNSNSFCMYTSNPASSVFLTSIILLRLVDISLMSARKRAPVLNPRSEEHTSELQSLRHLVCRLLLEKKKN